MSLFQFFQITLLIAHSSSLIAESEFGISKDDFKAKMYIALKECNESRYWLRLLNRASYLSNEEFDSIYNDSDEILKLLISITKTLKDNKKI